LFVGCDSKKMACPLVSLSFPIAPFPHQRWHYWPVTACHGIVRALVGWQQQGEKVAAGVH
jgi:hypothetical protein